MKYRRLPAVLILSAVACLTMLTACEDDPILAPNRGARAKGSYGSIAVAPAADTTADHAASRSNPELY